MDFYLAQHFFQAAALFFGRAAAASFPAGEDQAQRIASGQGQFFQVGGRRDLFDQFAGQDGRDPFDGEVLDQVLAHDRRLLDADDFSRLERMGRLGRLAGDLDAAAAAGLVGQTPGFKKARGPQPLIDSDCHCVLLIIHQRPYLCRAARFALIVFFNYNTRL